MKGEVFEFFFSLRDSDAQFDMGTADHGGASSWTARYVTVLSQARWLVLASWALLSVLAAWQGPLFLSECVMRMPPTLGGLIFSSLPGMNQWSFVLAVSVVVDTVFVRSMLVPAVMGVLNQHNWWPLELPAVSIREARLDFDVE